MAIWGAEGDRGWVWYWPFAGIFVCVVGVGAMGGGRF